MTRRPTKWLSRIVATNPAKLLTRPEGATLLDLLTNWWISGEGLLNGRAGMTDHSAHAAKQRYSQPRFYQLLAETGFPELPDADEHAIDQIHRAFLTWAASRNARKLISRISNDAQAREAISGSLREKQDTSVGDFADVDHQVAHAVHHEIHSYVHEQVHQQVHHHVQAEVHQHVHHQVHHAVTHAVHDAGISGHAGGGGHH